MRVSSPPVAKAEAILCPYCGSRQKVSLACESCGGRFDVASLQATQNDMGSWFVRDSRRPHFVGYSYHAIVAAIRSGEIGRDHIVRGPSTRQLWTVARRAAGIAHLFGRCYGCQGPVTSEDGSCMRHATNWLHRSQLLRAAAGRRIATASDSRRG
jgi:predicted amidophosphoribosyltransferase